MFIEAEANKAASKYDNASIDFQVDFYRREGLTPYSVAKLPITSGSTYAHCSSVVFLHFLIVYKLFFIICLCRCS